MRFTSLGSGSQGNATLISAGDQLLLIDCGFSALELERRMARRGCHPSDLSAILVTHEHADHVAGVGVLSRKYDLPVWLTRGTLQAVRDNRFHEIELIDHTPFEFGSLRVTPFPVPHDARQPCQFRFDLGRHRLGLLTDSGSITPHIEAVLEGCSTLMLEFNYDPQMLAEGPYPPALQRRIGSDWGHLSNHQARDFLSQRAGPTPNRLIAMHISEKNNSPERVRACLDTALGATDCDTLIASQHDGFDWITVE